jgi:hypothetical protein
LNRSISMPVFTVAILDSIACYQKDSPSPSIIK